MNRLSFLLTALLLLPAPAALAREAEVAAQGHGLMENSSSQLLARERGGGRRTGGGRSARGGNQARTGLGRQSSSLRRGDRKPSGGWSQRVGEGNRARASFDSSSLDRSRIGRVDRGDWNRAQTTLRDRAGRIDGDRVRRSFSAVDRDQVRDRLGSIDQNDWNRTRDRVDDRWDSARERVDDSWDRTRDRVDDRWDQTRDRVDDSWDRVERRVDRAIDRIDDWDNHWPGWVRPGWGTARPWNHGWYGGWNSPPWSWWNARPVAWGLGTLATASVINGAVNDAIAASRTTIMVPETDYTLLYNSVQPSDDQQLSFVVGNGQTRLTMQADCRSGLLNGQQPATAAQAQLLNAACQVAFGSA
ncbi:MULTISPECIES: hypothetical protein [Synechococcales]|uniref:hypothetical protein n=1 Tax=Synechococcus sp. CS-1326 TaxID=2847978 RepID=UPI00223C2CE9|nr:hypothetical protein [Synechococcus sp. CS-1326]MCT0213609.1 hypothetical protein [Synechococcus sp. CS-1326]